MTKKHYVLGNITRRDFIGGTLVAAGTGLLYLNYPLGSTKSNVDGALSDPWNGYGGTGDYAISNGNVASTRDAAHLIRDKKIDELLETTEDEGEEYDRVIIGGGFSGIGAAYEFHKKYGNTKKCLIIEDHPIFGGEAKQNEFEVDGYKIYGPQASNDFGPPDKDGDGLITKIYKDTHLPFELEYVQNKPEVSKVRSPLENFYGMYSVEPAYDTGYFMGENAETPWIEK